MRNFYSDCKIGILGGGQLGKMLIQAGFPFNLHFSSLDPDPKAPCKYVLDEDFTNGSLTDYGSVFGFAKEMDIVTIEIENVNTQALHDLKKFDIQVFPQPNVVALLQDKRHQKQFFKRHNIPTSDFVLVDSKEALLAYDYFLPAVQKLGREGYDGKGVCKILNKLDIPKGFDAPSVLERMVDIEKEISVIVARNLQGQVKAFAPVEMVFNPEANLVDYLLSPARISLEQVEKSKEIAENLINKLEMVGLLAVEMFISKSGEILVNEVAPRPHNSGHHTIEACYTSQYEQLLRAILNLELGDTTQHTPAAMVNLLGAENYVGEPVYKNLDKILALEGAKVHIYGKKTTKPYRKMGHVTILDRNVERLIEKVNYVKEHLKVIS